MFTSLSSRIAALGVLIVLSIIMLVAGMADASRQTQDGFRRVMHSGTVLRTLNETMAAARSAESAQRGFIVTQNPLFATRYDRELSHAEAAYQRAVSLTKDDPVQAVRLKEFGESLTRWRGLSVRPVEMGKSGDFLGARAMVNEGYASEAMEELESLMSEIVLGERDTQAGWVNVTDRRLISGRNLALIGGLLIAVFTGSVLVLVVYGIRRPIGILNDAMTRLGAGDFNLRIQERMGSREFGRLAKGYNSMASRLTHSVEQTQRSERELQQVHEELLVSARTLKDRNDIIALLGAMSYRMQATRSNEELAEVISIFVPRVLPGLSGALYSFSRDRARLAPVSRWGDPVGIGEGFSPNECWALRRGQSHWVSGEGKDIPCTHVHDKTVYHCEPLLASGEVIGVLHLDGLLDEEQMFRMSMLTENIASAMVNRRLQEDLKEQTIRDPLTGLFNRRYMEEALALEIARAARADTPLCVIMCDVDHFKRFNDDFGQDAGDAVLKAVAEVLVDKFRDGDIVCRYGGEEFTIIAPGTSAADLVRRTERVREAIAEVELMSHKEVLGPVTMSFGVAQWLPEMDKSGCTLLSEADASLYEAKREGRNRTVARLAAT